MRISSTALNAALLALLATPSIADEQDPQTLCQCTASITDISVPAPGSVPGCTATVSINAVLQNGSCFAEFSGCEIEKTCNGTYQIAVTIAGSDCDFELCTRYTFDDDVSTAGSPGESAIGGCVPASGGTTINQQEPFSIECGQKITYTVNVRAGGVIIARAGKELLCNSCSL
jgi:hypothetical protein